MAVFLGDATYINTRCFTPLFLKLADTEGGGPDTSEILDMSESLGFKKTRPSTLGKLNLSKLDIVKIVPSMKLTAYTWKWTVGR